MKDRLKDYDFGVCRDEQSVAHSVMEGRMVPRDLSGFDIQTKDKGVSYLYVDCNGVPKRLSVQDIMTNGIKIVDKEPSPADYDAGQIIFQEIK